MIERAKFDATTQLPPKMQSSVKKLTHFWKSACPTFVSAFGVDEFGQWMEFEIADVIQRLRWIPSGKFWMGSQVTEWGRYRDEGPRHEVMIGEGFWLFDTTCTNALWQAVMGREPSWLGVADRPVENISWKDAQRFIAIVNDLVPGLDLALPSEAHWEYACRAGTVTPFSFGETITLDQVNYDSRREKTVPVASLPPNAWGLYEMHGNVREWVGDAWHDRYVRAPRDGSVWDKAELTKRVLRGGSGKTGRLMSALLSGSRAIQRFGFPVSVFAAPEFRMGRSPWRRAISKRSAGSRQLRREEQGERNFTQTHRARR